MHVHGAGPRTFANIAYKMVSFPSLSTFIFPLFNCLLSNFLFFPLLYVVDEGFEEPVSYPDLVRKTHTRKDGTFIDERAENWFWRLSKRLKRCYKRDLRVEIAKLTQRLPQQLQSAFS